MGFENLANPFLTEFVSGIAAEIPVCLPSLCGKLVTTDGRLETFAEEDTDESIDEDLEFNGAMLEGFNCGAIRRAVVAGIPSFPVASLTVVCGCARVAIGCFC